MTIGNLRFGEERGVVHVEDVYATDIDDLWSALTDPARLARWVANVAAVPAPGERFDARFTSGWDGVLIIDVCEPPRRLLITSSPGEDDETTIEAVLTADENGTRLVIEERGFTRDQIAAHGAGWQAHVEDLSAYLSGAQRSDWEARWRELIPEYTKRASELP
jgi:uncharacterized protein YndB with AHSA1/START domain